jgi:hypothetical protein
MGLIKKGVGPIGLTGSIHHMEVQRRPIQSPKLQSLLMSVPYITFLLPNLEVEKRSMSLAAALVMLPQISIKTRERKQLKKVLIPQYG